MALRGGPYGDHRCAIWTEIQEGNRAGMAEMLRAALMRSDDNQHTEWPILSHAIGAWRCDRPARPRATYKACLRPSSPE